MSQVSQHPAPSSAKERNRFQSPPPPPSSITPPPSSRAPQLVYPTARTPTPTQSHLSSPPPTVKTPPHQQGIPEPGTPTRTTDDLANASSEDLRLMLASANAEVRAAKASAAHHRLQHELLSFEFAEAAKRFTVELEMAQKEVEVLHHAQAQAQIKIETPKSIANGAASSVPSPSDHTILAMKNHMDLLESENEALRRRLSDAKTLVLEREGFLSEENERLRRRIRENREHVNRLRQSGGVFGADDQSPQSVYQTPYSAASRHARDVQFSSSKSRNDEPFAALLLATDQVLSQEAASTPSTPIARPAKRHQAAHVRGAHSVSSLPSTPYRSAPTVPTQKVRGPYHAQPKLASSPLQNTPSSSRHLQRRRESRDSTISASDIDEQTLLEQDPERVLDSEDEARATSPSLSDGLPQEVYASQASQEAANMLRKSSSFSRQQKPTAAKHNRSKSSGSAISSSPTAGKSGGNNQSGSGHVQSKMYGYQIAKPGTSGQPESIKRRFYADDESPKASKKAKMHQAVDREAVGLGIGGWAASAR